MRNRALKFCFSFFSGIFERLYTLWWKLHCCEIGYILQMEIKLAHRPRWFVLYTAPRAEKRVAQRLCEQEIEYFLPTLMLERKWSDRVKVLEQPLFNSYIFVYVCEKDLPALNKVYGVVKTLYYNGAPATIRESEIKAIKRFVELSGERCSLVTGDMVEVVCGALAKGEGLVTGRVLKIKKEYLCIYVEQLGARVVVKRNQVQKYNARVL